MRIGFVVYSMQRQAVPLSPTDDVPRSALLELGWNAFKTISSRFGGFRYSRTQGKDHYFYRKRSFYQVMETL